MAHGNRLGQHCTARQLSVRLASASIRDSLYVARVSAKGSDHSNRAGVVDAVACGAGRSTPMHGVLGRLCLRLGRIFSMSAPAIYRGILVVSPPFRVAFCSSNPAEAQAYVGPVRHTRSTCGRVRTLQEQVQPCKERSEWHDERAGERDTQLLDHQRWGVPGMRLWDRDHESAAKERVL